MVPAPRVLCERARGCQVRAVWCRCSTRVRRVCSRSRPWGEGAGGPYGDDGTGGCRCRCLRVQFNERGEYCCMGAGFECKMPLTVRSGAFRDVVFGGVLLSHTLSSAVPSALEGLASGFGMGPGVSPPLWPP